MTMAEVRAKGFTINSDNFSIGRLTRRPFDRSLEANTLISIDPVQVVGTRRAIWVMASHCSSKPNALLACKK